LRLEFRHQSHRGDVRGLERRDHFEHDPETGPFIAPHIDRRTASLVPHIPDPRSELVEGDRGIADVDDTLVVDRNDDRLARRQRRDFSLWQLYLDAALQYRRGDHEYHQQREGDIDEVDQVDVRRERQ
jgi:hypothetical protein